MSSRPGKRPATGYHKKYTQKNLKHAAAAAAAHQAVDVSQAVLVMQTEFRAPPSKSTVGFLRPQLTAM